jgi:hypothetical protein
MRSHIISPFFIILIWVAAITGTCMGGNDILSDIKIRWKPSRSISTIEFDTANVSRFIGKTISVMEFGDVRLGLANKQNIGASPYSPFPITTVEDVPHWCAAHFSHVLATKGLTVVAENAAIQIEGEVKKFWVTEQGTYSAEVAILLTVKDTSGNMLWRDVVSGSSEAKGKSLDKKLYYRTLSDAMILAVQDFFKKANLEQTIPQ